MALPAFDNGWRHEKEKIKPRICMLEVMDRNTASDEPIARLFVERQESYQRDERDGRIFKASIRLSYETIEPKHSRQYREGECFSGSYSRGVGESNDSVSLVGGALFLDPDELRGQRIGTYLMNEIVTWAQQWPDANVRPIELRFEQAKDEENRARRNRFYERFGLVFTYRDPEHCEGLSDPILVKALMPVTSWEANIRERDPRDYLGELLYERERMVMDSSQRTTAIKNLTATLDDARLHPVRWAGRQLRWRISQILFRSAILLMLGTAIWAGLRLQ